jgi:hypothetical protein
MPEADKLDKELEKRGLWFVRYADDCVIFVRSKRAGSRVMESISPAESGIEGKLGQERYWSPVGSEISWILPDKLTQESEDPYPLENDQTV